MNTYGVELEIVGLSPRESAMALIRAGIEAQAEGYNHDTRQHWKVVTDGSLGTRYQGGHTAEVVSPILNVTDFEQLRKVTNALKSAGARVNQTCGTHVHIGGFNLSPSKVHRSAQFWNMCATFTDGLVSPSRRGNTRWAQRLNADELDSIESGDFDRINRYKSFNVVPINRLGTIEFRQHQGTLNATKLWAWADYCQAMVNYSQSDARLFIPNSLRELLTVLTETGHLTQENGAYLHQHAEELAG